MRTSRIVCLTNQRVIAETCFEAVRFLDRLRGLIGRSGLGPGEAMWFSKCSSIHTCWMRFAIDVVFLRPSQGGRKSWVVSSVHVGVRPWRWLVMDRSASAVLELGEGVAKERGLSPGDEVECIG